MAPTQRDPTRIDGNQLPGSDNLGSQYSKAADDGEQSEKKREAAMLYAVAETHLDDEAPKEVLSTIADAIKIFREIGDNHGLADALRLKMHGYRMLAEKLHEDGKAGKEERLLQEAEAEMREELSKFRACMDKRGEVAMLVAVAQALTALGGGPKKSEALDYLLDAQDIVREVGDAKLEASIVYERCQLLLKRHRYKQACQAAREAQKLFHNLGDSKMEGFCWFALGQGQVNNGRVEDGFVSKRKALSIYRRIGNKKLEGMCLVAFAEWYLLEREEFTLGIKAAQEAEAIFKELGDAPRELHAHRNMVDNMIRMKDYTKAMVAAKEGLETARNTGDLKEIFKATQEVARVYMESQQMDQAMDTADELLQMARDLEDVRWQFRALLEVGRILDEFDDWDKADEYGQQAIELMLENRRYEEELFSAIQFSGRCRIKADRYAEALDVMLMARKVGRRCEEPFLEANAMLGTSGTHYGLNDLESAKKAAFLARELFHEEGYARGEARVLKLALSDYFMEEQNFPEAIKCVQEGYRLMEEIGDNKMACMMKSRLADIYLEEGKCSEAAKAAMEALKLARMEEDKRSIVVVLFNVVGANYRLLQEVPEEDRMSKAYRQSVEKMARYAKEMLGLSVKLRDTELECNANLWMAKMNLMLGAFKEAMVAAESSVELARDIKEFYMEIAAKLTLASAQDAFGETQQAIETLKMVMEQSYEAQYSDGVAEATSLLEQILGTEGASNVFTKDTFSPLVQESGAQGLVSSRQKAFQPPNMAAVTWFITEKLKEMSGTTDPIDADVPVLDTGMDSLTIVELRTQLQQEFKVNLPSTVMNSYPTASAIARLIVDECRNKGIEWRR